MRTPCFCWDELTTDLIKEYSFSFILKHENLCVPQSQFLTFLAAQNRNFACFVLSFNSKIRLVS